MASFRHLRFLSLYSNAFTQKVGRVQAAGFVGTRNLCVSTAAEVLDFEKDEPRDDVRSVEKDAALRQAISSLAGDFGRESMLSLQRFFRSRRLPVISTGSLMLDLALGIGGLPKGRIVEIYGQEASGKTTLALHIIKEAQKMGGYCAYLDVENALDPSLAESLGVNTENLLISQPDSAENLLCMVDTLTKSGSIDVIVVDSVAALVPQKEIDVEIGDMERDMQSMIMTQALRKIHYSLCQSQTLVIFVNQVRSKPRSGKDFGYADETTCGGNSLPFYAAVRLRISRTGLIKTEDKVTGLAISVKVMKNKLSPPLKKADLAIKFGKGISCESEVLDLACEHEIIIKDGQNFYIEKDVLRSRNEAETYLVENQAIFDRTVHFLRSKLFQK